MLGTEYSSGVDVCRCLLISRTKSIYWMARAVPKHAVGLQGHSLLRWNATPRSVPYCTPAPERPGRSGAIKLRYVSLSYEFAVFKGVGGCEIQQRGMYCRQLDVPCFLC